MEITLRLERPEDFRAVEELTREAFWDLYNPGCSEHYILHELRKLPAFVPELDFVALVDGQIAGHIVYSRAKIVQKDGFAHEVLTFGPISVLPSYQGKGVGSRLIRETLRIIRQTGIPAVVLLGNPDYYHRFGFVSASKYLVSFTDGSNFDAFMLLETKKGAMEAISGTFFLDPVFTVDEGELEKYDASFPPREKHVTDTQLK
jgi:predicted N-acetyltransferase YhbS